MIKNVILISVFLAMLVAVPVATIVTPHGQPVLFEMRELNKLPNIPRTFNEVRGFPLRFQRYYTDNMAFRPELVSLYCEMMSDIFNKSPTPMVVIGKDKWLYYIGDNSLEDYRGLERFTDERLLRIKNDLVHRHDVYQKNGIKHILIVAPNKQTIYPEHMPDRFNRVNSKTRLDQLIEYLNATSDIRILDMRALFWANKNSKMLYSKTDSHWVGDGYMMVYNKLLEEAHSLLPSKHFRELSLIPGNKYTADLLNIIGHPHGFPSTVPAYRIKDQGSIRVEYSLPVRLDFGPNTGPVKLENKYSSGKVLMFGDSFSKMLERPIAEQFNASIFVWNKNGAYSSYDTDTAINIVLSERPDLVIEEISERLLNYL